MLEKPDLPDSTLVSALQEHYGLNAANIGFLPLGTDQQSAVYRVIATDGMPYFLKVRLGAVADISVTLPRYLSDQGILQIIPPLQTRAGQLWVKMDTCSLILYPFVQGQDGYQVHLSPQQWRDLGRVLWKIHATLVPPAIGDRIPQETYASRWRQRTQAFLARIADWDPVDPIVVDLVAFLKAKRAQILDLVKQAERLAQRLRIRSPECVLCHADIHPGNVLVDTAGAFYIVDWDDPIFAPKERDLMFIGGGHWGNGQTALNQETQFYRGYGPTQVDPIALAYYRFERIVEDIAVFCEHIGSIEEGRHDRQQSLRYLKANFLPGSTVEAAYGTDLAPIGIRTTTHPPEES